MSEVKDNQYVMSYGSKTLKTKYIKNRVNQRKLKMSMLIITLRDRYSIESVRD